MVSIWHKMEEKPKGDLVSVAIMFKDRSIGFGTFYKNSFIGCNLQMNFYRWAYWKDVEKVLLGS